MSSSAFEHNRVLKAVLQRTDLSEQARVGALESAAAIESDFEAASFLLQFVKTSGVEGAARAPFFRAVASIDSAFERGRVLQALCARTDVSDADRARDRAVGADRSTSNHERAQVLLAVAANSPAHARSAATPTSTRPRSWATTSRAGCCRRW